MIRFSTVAANADVLGDDTPLASEPDVASRRPRIGPDRPEHRRGRQRGKDVSKPSRDVNATGLPKGEESKKPS